MNVRAIARRLGAATRLGSLQRPPRSQHGFTLVELMVVAAILIAVSFIAYSTFDGVVDAKKEEVARAEMLEIARAIRQFKQDTGYYPKQGPFDHVDYGGAVDPDCVDLLDVEGNPPADPKAWLHSPANFWQLFNNPLKLKTSPDPSCVEHMLAEWHPSTGRGWRGPYLMRDAETSFALSSGLSPTGDGDPTGSDLLVYGIADPFQDRNGDYGPFFAFDVADTTAGLHDPASTSDSDYKLRPRMVSMGLDGYYGGRDDADPCESETTDDDLILCFD